MKNLKTYVNKYLAGFLETMHDGIFITDINYIVQFVNSSYLDFSGLKREEIIGKHIYDIRPGGYLSEIFRTLKPIYNVPRKVKDTESYCDYIPIIIERELKGGLVIVKDAAKTKELSRKLQDSNEKISQLNAAVSELFKVKTNFEDIIGADKGLKEVIALAQKAAASDNFVLLLGESGTGKDMVAKAIHNASKRRNRPFVDINCAALPEYLLESELFGYVGGAFTGADKKGKIGLFEVADGGTVFLDEIAEMPVILQAKLLRVLQEKTIRKLGAEKTININVRIIAATNQNIIQLIGENKFREDLYYRIAVFVFSLPPLRERKSDIPLFIDKFIQDMQARYGKYIMISPEAMELILKYNWPGNVRELKNTIEYATGVSYGSIINITDLPKNILDSAASKNISALFSQGSLTDIMNSFEKQVLQNYLSLYGDNGDNKRAIAQNLNISLSSLYSKLKKYSL